MAAQQASAPLAQQIQHLVPIIEQVCFAANAKRPLDTLLDQAPVHLRSGLQALSFAVLRQAGTAQALMHLLVPKCPPAPVQALLTCALALLQQKEPHAQYNDFALVHQSVEAAKGSARLRPFAGLANAVLRNYIRGRGQLHLQMLQDAKWQDIAQWNHPQWWIARLKKNYPDHWKAILHNSHTRAPLSLRINTLSTSVREYAALLSARAIAHSVVAAPAHDRPVEGLHAIEITHSVRVQDLPLYQEGGFVVQDAAAQCATLQLLSAEYLAELKARQQRSKKPIRILDACAAPGGKTTHLLERLAAAKLPAHVVALEIDAQRLSLMQENLHRMGMLALHSVTLDARAAHAADLPHWWDGLPFDAVLLDAPCSASGIVRRRPDVPWLRQAQDIERLAVQQRQLLQALWRTVRPGGRLLYAVCSVFHAEGEEQISRWLAAHKGTAKRLDSAGIWLPSDNLVHPTASHDGFFDALIEKVR